MSTEPLAMRLEVWKRILALCIGVCLTLLFLALTSIPQSLGRAWGWYIVWIIFQTTVVPPGFILLLSKGWRAWPLSERLNTAFGYLAVAWLLFLAFLIKSNRDEASAYGGLVTLMLYALVIGAAVVLSASYGWLRRSRDTLNEEIFP